MVECGCVATPISTRDAASFQLPSGTTFKYNSIAGDVLQNLMSALDHLAYQIVCNDTEDCPPNPNWIYFPIADDSQKYEAKKLGKIKGAKKETVDVIDAIQPYQEGNELLWALYRLNNIDKHRLLITVGSQAGGINLGQLMAHGVRSEWSSEACKRLESMNIFINPANKGFPLDVGFPLYIGGVGEEVNPILQFRFEIALNEPGIIEGKPLLEILHQLTKMVEDIIEILTPRLT